MTIPRTLSAIGLLATLLAACSQLPWDSEPALPGGAVDAVSDATQRIVTALGWWEFSGLTVTDSESISLTPAQVANGVSESWCVAVAYAARTSPSEPWFDFTATWRVDYSNGVWDTAKSYDAAENCDVVW